MANTSDQSQNLILYNYFRSSTSYRVRCALHLKNLSFTYIPVHLVNNGGEQNLPEYRKLNPLGGVPTLVHANEVISQSYSIIQYLDGAFPSTKSLFPKSLKDHTNVSQFCQIINADMHSYGNLKTLQYLEKIFKVDQDGKEKFIARFFQEGFEALEKFVEKNGSTYCYGSEVTAADCFLVPVIFTAQRFNVKLDRYPKLLKINENLSQRAEVQKAHPFRQVDTPADIRLT